MAVWNRFHMNAHLSSEESTWVLYVANRAHLHHPRQPLSNVVKLLAWSCRYVGGKIPPANEDPPSHSGRTHYRYVLWGSCIDDKWKGNQSKVMDNINCRRLLNPWWQWILFISSIHTYTHVLQETWWKIYFLIFVWMLGMAAHPLSKIKQYNYRPHSWKCSKEQAILHILWWCD